MEWSEADRRAIFKMVVPAMNEILKNRSLSEDTRNATLNMFCFFLSTCLTADEEILNGLLENAETFNDQLQELILLRTEPAGEA